MIKKTLAIVSIATIISCGNQRKEVKALSTELDTVSYSVGLNMSKQLNTSFSEVDREVLVQGILDGLDSTEALVETKDIERVLTTYFKKKQEAQKLEDEAKSEVYKQEGIAFLEANKAKEGVVTTESGLQYTVIKAGNGNKPENATTKVKVHYHGTLIDGTVFDSSVDRGTPAEFGLNQVIKGWTEGLQLMDEGAKYKFFIPQELGYGANPRGGAIKPFMTLVFEVELLEILK